MDSICNISFIIPLYNLQDWIVPCLESIYRAKLDTDTFEIIVWDDGSKDLSADVVAEYAITHPQVRLISRENHGVSYVRNHAIEEARGTYVWFVDSDDEVCSDNVEQLLKIALKSELDMLLFNWKPINQSGVQENIVLHEVKTSSVMPGRNLYMNSMISMAPWCFIYRRDFLIDNDLTFPEDFKTCEDIQFNQKALWYAKRTMSSDLIGYFYRQMNVSATQGNSARLVDDQIRRIPIEVDFFSKLKDWEYLTVVLYRNLREINVWISIDKSDDLVYDKISKVLSCKNFKIRPLLGLMTLYIYMMRINPHMINRLQSFAKKVKFALR